MHLVLFTQSEVNDQKTQSVGEVKKRNETERELLGQESLVVYNIGWATNAPEKIRTGKLLVKRNI